VKDSITVVSATQGPVHINADQAKLKAETNGSGNIYYRGAPSSMAFNKYGLGDLIDDN
jgi:lipopolysaccharide export system protein LptA